MESKRLTPTIVGKIASKRFVVAIFSIFKIYLYSHFSWYTNLHSRRTPNGCFICFKIFLKAWTDTITAFLKPCVAITSNLSVSDHSQLVVAPMKLISITKYTL